MHRLILVFVLVTACAVPTYGPPATFDLRTDRPLRDAHQCVTEQVVDAGFAVTETRRDDGILRAVRQTTTIGQRMDTTTWQGRTIVRESTRSDSSWGRVEVLLFERNDGSTSIQYTAASGPRRSGPWREPTEGVVNLAGEIVEACR